MIELRPLRQFVAVAEELHFGRAAARLAMTQPPLTQAVQALERKLGVMLFARSRRSVMLTPAGHALLDEARRLLRAAVALPAAVQAAALGRTGRLRLAFVSSIAYGALPLWLRSFREAYPTVQLHLREATLDVQLAAFAANEIDAGFVLHAPGAAPGGFASVTVQREAMWLALPEGHPASARKTLQTRDIADAPLLIFPRAVTPSLYDALLAGQRARGLTPQVAQEAIQMQTLVNLVSAGIGVAWVPETVTRLQRPGVVYRRVAGEPVMAETSLIWREPAAPVVQRFVAEVQARVTLQQRPRAQRRQSRPV
ncbi:MAG: LysR family transcriptional regulator [Burkholderiaceae bacterium]|nr:LysR family transcriptional regulator [Burkholderiaceae bacterium]